MREVEAVNQKCFFCGKPDATLHDEHYYSCLCGAAYTYLMVQERNCDHIPGHEPDSCPVVRLLPDDEALQEGKVFIYEPEIMTQFCSKCGQRVVADGW